MSTFPRFYSHYVISDTPSWLRGGWAGTWWARLRTRKDRGFEARPWSKAEKPTPLKTNFTTEPATAPPALAFYPCTQTTRLNVSFVEEYVPINPISIIYPTQKADPSADTLARPDFSRNSSAKTVATYPQPPNTSCLTVHGHRRPRSFRCRRSWKVR